MSEAPELKWYVIQVSRDTSETSTSVMSSWLPIGRPWADGTVRSGPTDCAWPGRKAQYGRLMALATMTATRTKTATTKATTGHRLGRTLAASDAEDPSVEMVSPGDDMGAGRD